MPGSCDEPRDRGRSLGTLCWTCSGRKWLVETEDVALLDDVPTQRAGERGLQGMQEQQGMNAEVMESEGRTADKPGAV